MPKQINEFFPQGLALGENFCNRLLERERLQSNMASNRPTLIMARRRFGKTSLVLNVLKHSKIPYGYIDLYSELNEIEVQNSILGSIGDILYSIESTPKKALKFVTDFFSDLSVSFKLIGAEISIEFSRSKKPPARTILESLKKLDETLKLKKKKVVMFFDEFQRISQIADSSTIEGAIRHVAQESKNITFIFSGSNRHLLNRMFDDRSQPLYKLCDRITLDRIESSHYLPFIQEKFNKKWKKLPKLAQVTDTISAILNLTERHPYYVNVLCHRLLLSDNFPNEIDVEAEWRKYAIEEKTNVLGEIDLLSSNQAKMLIAIAKYSDEILPMSKDFIALTKFSLSSASQSIKALEKMDYVYINHENKYVINDPLIKYIFSTKF